MKYGKRKLMWLDVETTGLSAFKNGIIQLAFLVEDYNGDVIDKLNVTMKPFIECEYEPKALEINQKTIDDIKQYDDERDVFTKKIFPFIQKYFDGTKYSIAGYNTQFDMKFLQALFRRNTTSRWDYFFNYYDVDTYALVKLLNLSGILYDKECKKLGAICNTMDISIKGNAHDALVDIKATRKLHRKIIKRYMK